MNESLQEAIARELSPKEKLLWAGQPRQGIVFRSFDIVFIPFSVVWGGFAIFWEIMVIVTGAPFFFWLWGIPFVLVGLYIMIGRFWVDARRRAATAYAVTSDRVIIISGMWSRRTTSLDLATVNDVTLTERSNGGGIITFGPFKMTGQWMTNADWIGQFHHLIPVLDIAENAREVYEIIRRARHEARMRAAAANPPDSTR
jgi:hypothetical protein